MTLKQRRIWIWGAGIVFLILAALFFYQKLFIAEHTWRWIIALPTLTLSLLTLRFSRECGLFIPAALLASTVGDYYGSESLFILQVAFFAVAHIFYIADFLPRRRVTKGRIAAAATFLAAAILYVGHIITNIPFGVNSIAIGIYGIIIATMGITAIIQQRKHRGWYIVAALLFVFSDGVIAYGFVGEIAHSTLWIMTTYYTAQALFALLATTRKSPKE